jgi:chromosome segregation ATPase
MNISSATGAAGQYASGTGSADRGDSSDNSAKIKDLEGEKSQLEQKLKDARNPFSTKPSDEYMKLKKEIAEVERQIQDLKAESQKKDQASSSSRSPFDQYKPGEDKLETGAYSQSMDEDQKRVLY